MVRCGTIAHVGANAGNMTLMLPCATGAGHSGPDSKFRSSLMLANNAILILMIVFNYAVFMIVLFWAGGTVPRQLDRRKQRQITQMIAGAELLADAIGRTHNNPALLDRLTENYNAHARALTQLGQDVPALSVDASMARAA